MADNWFAEDFKRDLRKLCVRYGMVQQGEQLYLMGRVIVDPFKRVLKIENPEGLGIFEFPLAQDGVTTIDGLFVGLDFGIEGLVDAEKKR